MKREHLLRCARDGRSAQSSTERTTSRGPSAANAPSRITRAVRSHRVQRVCLVSVVFFSPFPSEFSCLGLSALDGSEDRRFDETPGKVDLSSTKPASKFVQGDVDLLKSRGSRWASLEARRCGEWAKRSMRQVDRLKCKFQWFHHQSDRTHFVHRLNKLMHELCCLSPFSIQIELLFGWAGYVSLFRRWCI